MRDIFASTALTLRTRTSSPDENEPSVETRAFCPTGPGGGIDNSCSSSGESGGSTSGGESRKSAILKESGITHMARSDVPSSVVSWDRDGWKNPMAQGDATMASEVAQLVEDQDVEAFLDNGSDGVQLARAAGAIEGRPDISEWALGDEPPTAEQVRSQQERADAYKQAKDDFRVELETADKSGWNQKRPNFSGEPIKWEVSAQLERWCSGEVLNSLSKAPLRFDVAQTEDGRPFYTESTDAMTPARVVIGKNAAFDDKATVFHEVGHHIETTVPGAAELCADFILKRGQRAAERRLDSSPPELNLEETSPGRDNIHSYSIKDIDGGEYDESERVIPGNFRNNYAGKIYYNSPKVQEMIDKGQSPRDVSTKLSTEVLSMGVQYLYDDPLTFAREDPEHFALTVNILRGRSIGWKEKRKREKAAAQEETRSAEYPFDTTAFVVARAFCPTGPGGGIDNSCSSSGGSAAPVPGRAGVEFARRTTLTDVERVGNGLHTWKWTRDGWSNPNATGIDGESIRVAEEIGGDQHSEEFIAEVAKDELALAHSALSETLPPAIGPIDEKRGQQVLQQIAEFKEKVKSPDASESGRKAIKPQSVSFDRVDLTKKDATEIRSSIARELDGVSKLCSSHVLNIITRSKPYFYIDGTTDRPSFDSSTDSINLSPRGWLDGSHAESIAHEYGHHIEVSLPGAAELCADFVLKRAARAEQERAATDPREGGTSAMPRAFRLIDIDDPRHYSEKEIVFPGTFRDPYVGKVYPKQSNVLATEVLSMGVEWMRSDPRRFAREDPEHFALTLAILRGKTIGWKPKERKAKRSIAAAETRAFCPTGPGGGIDNSCSSSGGQSDTTISGVDRSVHERMEKRWHREGWAKRDAVGRFDQSVALASVVGDQHSDAFIKSAKEELALANDSMRWAGQWSAEFDRLNAEDTPYSPEAHQRLKEQDDAFEREFRARLVAPDVTESDRPELLNIVEPRADAGERGVLSKTQEILNFALPEIQSYCSRDVLDSIPPVDVIASPRVFRAGYVQDLSEEDIKWQSDEFKPHGARIVLSALEVEDSDGTRAFFHEFGHHIEQNVPGATDMCIDFVLRRGLKSSDLRAKETDFGEGEARTIKGRDSAAEQFAKVAGVIDRKQAETVADLVKEDKRSLVPSFEWGDVSAPYDAKPKGERVVPGSFRDPYVGKMYYQDNAVRAALAGRTDVSRKALKLATEVMSMGLQWLHDNPAKFAREDPEHFALTLAILRGKSIKWKKREKSYLDKLRKKRGGANADTRSQGLEQASSVHARERVAVRRRGDEEDSRFAVRGDADAQSTGAERAVHSRDAVAGSVGSERRSHELGARSDGITTERDLLSSMAHAFGFRLEAPPPARTHARADVRGFCATGPGGGIDNSCSSKSAIAAARADDFEPTTKKVERMGSTLEGALAKKGVPSFVAQAAWLRIRGTLSSNEAFCNGGMHDLKVSTRTQGELKRIAKVSFTSYWSAPSAGKDFLARTVYEETKTKWKAKREFVRYVSNSEAPQPPKPQKGSRAFCPTGEGGGIDNSCGSGGTKAEVWPNDARDVMISGTGTTVLPLGDRKKYSDLVDTLRKDEGFTWEPLNGRLLAGDSKLVSPYPERSKVFESMDDITPDVLADYAIANLDLIMQPSHFFGGWFEKKEDGTGRVYLDVTVARRTHEEARQEALDNDQKAYFDLATFTTIEVNPNAKSGQRSTHGRRREARETGSWWIWQADRGADCAVVQVAHREGRNRRATGIGAQEIGSGVSRALSGTLVGEMVARAFCPTGPGGGIDNSCAPSNSGDQVADQVVRERVTDPPSGKPVHSSKITDDSNGDGVQDRARVGVDAFAPPPPTVPRLPNLSERERAVETHFADQYEADPQAAVDAYNAMRLASKQPGTFETDAAKMLDADWKGRTEADGELSQGTKDYRSAYNVALHQTANLIVKTAFLQELDRLADLPEDKRTVLVTAGGCGVGKGYCLEKVPQMMEQAEKASAVWDSAGDQNASENPWILAECEKRGIKPTFVYVHRDDPENVWSDPKRGIFERAKKQGRMIDARVFADSYVVGARNFHAFQKSVGDRARFLVINNDPVKGPHIIDGVPESARRKSRKKLIEYAEKSIRKANGVRPAIVQGATAGGRVWGDDAINGD